MDKVMRKEIKPKTKRNIFAFGNGHENILYADEISSIKQSGFEIRSICHLPAQTQDPLFLSANNGTQLFW